MRDYEIPEPAHRGVYWTRHTYHGRRELYAVSSRGERLGPMLAIDIDNPILVNAAVRTLWSRLDRFDPAPALVRSERAARVEAPPIRARVIPLRPGVRAAPDDDPYGLRASVHDAL